MGALTYAIAPKINATTKNATPTSGAVSHPSSSETAMTAVPANTNRSASGSDLIGRRIVALTLRCAHSPVMRENCDSEYGLFADSCKARVKRGAP